MLKISPDTFSRMAAVEEDRFIAKLAGFLQTAVPSLASEPASAMHEQVRQLMQSARGYEMKSERAVATYAATAALLGVDFPERFAGAKEILLAYKPQDEKCDLLEAFTIIILEVLAR